MTRYETHAVVHAAVCEGVSSFGRPLVDGWVYEVVRSSAGSLIAAVIGGTVNACVLDVVAEVTK